MAIAIRREGTWYCDTCPPSKKMCPKTNDGGKSQRELTICHIISCEKLKLLKTEALHAPASLILKLPFKTGNNRLNCFLCDYDLCAECCVVAEKQVAVQEYFMIL